MIIINLTSWAWPQWIMASLLILEIIAGGCMHGLPRSNPNFSVGSAIINVLATLTLLVFGGFFS